MRHKVRATLLTAVLAPAVLAVCFLAGCAGTAGSGNSGNNSKTSAASISVQPANQSVTAGQTATFAVTAAGTAPISYQWQRNGTNIVGATAASYTTPAATLADNGTRFNVVVSNSAGSVTSNSATLTVNSPTGAPTLSRRTPAATISTEFTLWT